MPTSCLKAARNLCVIGPELPSPMGCPSILITGMASVVVPAKKTSSAPLKFAKVVNSSATGISSLWANSSNTPRVIPGKICGPAGAVLIHPERTQKTLVEDPSVTWSSASINKASKAPACFACCLAKILGNKEMLFISQRFHRRSGVVITSTPFWYMSWGNRCASLKVIITVGATDFTGNSWRLGDTPRVT